jgi:GH24 family phage-related lysozyme (muramidase)
MGDQHIYLPAIVPTHVNADRVLTNPAFWEEIDRREAEYSAALEHVVVVTKEFGRQVAKTMDANWHPGDVPQFGADAPKFYRQSGPRPQPYQGHYAYRGATRAKIDHMAGPGKNGGDSRQRLIIHGVENLQRNVTDPPIRTGDEAIEKAKDFLQYSDARQKNANIAFTAEGVAPRFKVVVQARAQQQQMSVSQQGQDFIRGYEKLSLTTYDANPPHGDWTIGYGHKVSSSDFAAISRVQAEQFFSQDVSKMAAHVNADLKVGVTQNQFDALVSLRFNVGANALTPPVADLNRTGHATMGDFTNHYITAGGVKMRGLELRRAAEWKIFNKGVYDATH